MLGELYMFSLTDTQAEEANGASRDPVFPLVISSLFKTEVPHAKHFLCDHRNPDFSENMGGKVLSLI